MIWRWVLSIGTITVLAFVGLLWFAGQLYATAQQREVTYRYFSEALVDLAAQKSIVSWELAERPLDRPLSKADEIIVGEALTVAWQSFGVALEKGTPEILQDRFSQVALERAQTAASDPTGMGMVVLDMKAKPAFYHSDGSVLQIEAEALTARYAFNEDQVAFHGLSTDQVTTTLLNGANGWKVAMHKQTDAKPVAKRSTTTQVPRLAGINYYPAETPWTLFWPNLRRATLDEDFALISELGANAIRIFLQRDAFTGPQMLEENLPKLRGLLQAAERQGLWVVPTLFDLRGGYETAYWTDDYLSLLRILPILDAAPNVAYVDLKNEPDLDFEAHSRGIVEAWARTMLGAARKITPDLPFTIGWAKAEAATVLMDELDILSYHAYGELEQSQQKLNDILTKAGNKPVHITELGATSFNLFAGIPSSPALQAKAVEDRIMALDGAEGLFLWTLHDFPEPDKAAIGGSPWVRALQAEYGLLDATGAEKPAANVVREYFNSFLENPDG